jgi:hypothetical protein
MPNMSANKRGGHWRQLQNRGFGHVTVLIDQGDARHASVIERRHHATLCDPGQLGVPIAGHGSEQFGCGHNSSNSLWKVGDPQI